MTKSTLTLLVVEDETLVAMDLEDVLEDLGHVVIDVAGSPEQALCLLENRRAEIDAVLLDANLGGDSALPVALRLKDLGIPFVVTSGYEQQELHREGFDAPWVGKPYKPSDIDGALRTVSRASTLSDPEAS